ncbi:hypothetical protein RB597_006955 [Gaeumannomyces tritici]
MSHDQEHVSDAELGRYGYVQGNDHALPYLSKWSREMAVDLQQVPAVLQHLNCSYLSTPGQAPTLLALKQHLQSLAVVVAQLCVTDKAAAGEIGGAGDGETRRKIQLGDAMDWLSSLTTPYANDDPDHHRRLNSLLNEVEAHHDVLGTQYHCALRSGAPSVPRGEGEPGPVLLQQPYASHHNLLMHANACLERLDHELSAQGGILAIMPTDDAVDDDERRGARNTLLGQLLAFAQALVGRTHDLELSHAHLTDLLRGEAVAPRQHLSALGPDARSVGRQPVYPQDRWVLANAGDDVFGHLHRLLDREEALVGQKEKIWRQLGAVGERIWEEERGKAYARGIVHITVPTRYYRIKRGPDGGGGGGGGGSDGNTTNDNDDPGTIFVIPAWEHHPGVEHTRRMEQGLAPTVASVPTPHWPERVSELQERYHGKAVDGVRALVENEALRARVAALEADVVALRGDRQRVEDQADVLSEFASVQQGAKALATEVAYLRQRIKEFEAKEARMVE